LKNTYKALTIFFTILLLIACGDHANQSGNNDTKNSSEGISDVQNDTTDNTDEPDRVDTQDNHSAAIEESTELSADNSNHIPSEESNNETAQDVFQTDDDNPLVHYSSREIEYARVWLQLGPNPDIDELNVRHIAAGEPVNPSDDMSVNYPEDVTSLAGSRSVDGAITYSSNGDGTINIYEVPLHWESPAQVEKGYMQTYTEKIIHNTKLAYIDPGDDDQVINLIEIINIHH